MAITVVLLWALLPVIGLMGAAIATAAAYLAELIVVIYGLRRTHSISPGSLFRFKLGDLNPALRLAILPKRSDGLALDQSDRSTSAL